MWVGSPVLPARTFVLQGLHMLRIFKGLDGLIACPLHEPGPRGPFRNMLFRAPGLVLEDVRQDPTGFSISMRCCRVVHLDALALAEIV